MGSIRTARVGVACTLLALVTSGCFLFGGSDMTCAEYRELGTSTDPDDEQVDLILEYVDEDDLVLPATDLSIAHRGLRSWCNQRDDFGEFERADTGVSEYLRAWEVGYRPGDDPTED